MIYLDKFINNKLLLVLVSIVALHCMDFNQSQSSSWIAPYLSAAANFDWNSFSMHVDFEQINYFATLTKDAQFKYVFPIGEHLVNYNYLALGFLFIEIVAKNLFFFLGDLEAIQALQYVFHIAVSLLLFNQLKYKYEKILFFILYMVNPIILYFVNFPFYYFWQVVPSAILAYYYLNNKNIKNIIFIITIIFVFIYITRPTVLFVILFFYMIYGFRESWSKSVIAIALFFGLMSSITSSGFGPWHTMYIGIGGYDNKYDIKLSDESGYSYFKQQTGKIISSTSIVNEDLRKEYYKILKNRYFELLSDNPILFVRNALFNVASSYSFGYKTGNKKLIYLSIISGFIFMVLLLFSRQYILFFAIGFAAASFTLYYPPIPAYMYGSYILIVLGVIGVVQFFMKRYGR